MQAKEPNSPRHNSGTTTPSCQATSATIGSPEAINAKIEAPATNTANEVEVTARGSSFFVIESV